MENWIPFCGKIRWNPINIRELQGEAAEHFDVFGVYPGSISEAGGCLFFIAKTGFGKALVIQGQSAGIFSAFSGKAAGVPGIPAKVCDLSAENSRMIRQLFPYANPVSHQGRKVSIGLGDRLGQASPGHIATAREFKVFPVLAQQSMRELNLTGRNYGEVLAAAVWAVFQEGFRDGYGADGDHLKTGAEVQMALDSGFSMITLDCSEHIDNAAASLPMPEVRQRYAQIPGSDRSRYEESYLGKTVHIDEGVSIHFDPDAFMRTVLIYRKAISHTISIYREKICQAGRPVDFEVSIDETLTPTSPESHYFTAAELAAEGVAVTSLAPRFCGEFQKGIDYRGDIRQFAKEFDQHARIADHFGYKISVHSGSDKFSVFPIIGAGTRGRFHLKTAGTNWLEAVRIMAVHEPGLYRRMHQFALENLDAAKKYYHISADPSRVPPPGQLADSELAGLMDQDDARQVLHITYGLILQAKKPDGSSLFKDEFFSALQSRDQEYAELLKKHIGRHLRSLGLSPGNGK